jgi:antitoxin MazE
MKAQIIRIGNSQGIRIPKAILEQCHISNTVEMTVENDKLILSAAKVREGWAESFQEMAINHDDELIIEDTISSEYDEEWEW